VKRSFRHVVLLAVVMLFMAMAVPAAMVVDDWQMGDQQKAVSQLRDRYDKKKGSGVLIAKYADRTGRLTAIAYRAEDGAFIYATPSILVMRDQDGRVFSANDESRKIEPFPESKHSNADYLLDNFMSEPIVRDLVENPALIDRSRVLDGGVLEIEATFLRGNRGLRKTGPFAELNPPEVVRYTIDKDGLVRRRELVGLGLAQDYNYDPRSRASLEIVGTAEFAGARQVLQSVVFDEAQRVAFEPTGAVRFASEQTAPETPRSRGISNVGVSEDNGESRLSESSPAARYPLFVAAVATLTVVIVLVVGILAIKRRAWG
jgi:hypothetical protein